MHLTFIQTTDDLLDLNKHSLKNNRGFKIVMIVVAVVVLLQIILSISAERKNWEALISWLLPMLMIIGAWYVIFRWIIKRRFSNQENRALLTGPREIELNEKEIKVWTPQSETKYQWSAITKLEESNQNYFLFMGNMQAILISKTAFENVDQKNEFLAIVNGRI